MLLPIGIVLNHIYRKSGQKMGNLSNLLSLHTLQAIPEQNCMHYPRTGHQKRSCILFY
jgi:hypothetical protein